MEIKAFLQEITRKRGLSGDEGPVAHWVAERFQEYCDEVKVDKMSSVVGRIKGEGPKLIKKAACMRPPSLFYAGKSLVKEDLHRDGD